MSNLALGYRKIQRLLTWALALSWVPIFGAAVLAALVGQPLHVFFFGIVLICWLLKLGDLFDVFED